jgi:signal transduction histidine kinase
MAMPAWLRRIVIVATVIAIALWQESAPASSDWRSVLTGMYYLPVIVAALWDGWRGGLAVAVIAGAALLQHVFRTESAAGMPPYYFEAGLLFLVGVVTGLYTDHERREKRRHQEVAEQLSDVYERLQSNFEGMKRAERLSALGQLSAGLAHEIRNPLASIEGAVSILRRTTPNDPKAVKCMDIVESESKRLNGLLTTFLNFARPRPPQLQYVSVDSILDSVLALAEHAIGRRNIDFRRQVAPGVPPIQCDPEQMTQVLLNLVINATEASDAGGAVTLIADQSDQTVRIRIVDEGCGVPPEDIDKLFNPFFTTKETGTGLGLPVAHQIVGQMGGLLTAHRNPTGGMTFTIQFPIKQVRSAV